MSCMDDFDPDDPYEFKKRRSRETEAERIACEDVEIAAYLHEQSQHEAIASALRLEPSTPTEPERIALALSAPTRRGVR